MKRIILLAVMAIIAFQTSALADSVWKGDLGVGFVSTQGNSDSETFNTKFSVLNESDNWRNSLKASALFSKAQEETIAEKYSALFKTNYKITKNDFVFLNATYDRDLFTQFDYQFSESFGYGRVWHKTESMHVDTEIGAGARQSKFKEREDLEKELVYHLAANFRWDFTKTATFKEEFSADFGDEFNIFKSSTSLSAQMSNRWSLKLSFDVEHVTEVPEDMKKTDTTTSASVVYKF